MSGKLIQITDDDNVCLLQSPDIIAQHIQRSLDEAQQAEQEPPE